MTRRQGAVVAFLLPFVVVALGYGLWWVMNVVRPPLWVAWLGWALVIGVLLSTAVMRR